MKHTKKFLAALLLPVVIALAGCEIKMAIDVQDESNGVMTMDMIIPADMVGMMGDEGADCNAMMSDFPAPESGEVDVAIEDISEGGNLACRMTAKGAIFQDDAEGMGVTKDGDNLIFAMKNSGGEGLSESMGEMQGMEDMITFSMAITMPEDITSATPEGGTVEGRTVTWTDTVVTSQDIEVVSPAGSGAALGGGSGGSAGGMGWVTWLIVGLIVVVAAGAIVLVLVMRKKKGAGAGAGAGGGYPQQPYGAPGGMPGQPGGYPQGMPGQPGMQPGMPGGVPMQPGQPGAYPQQPYGTPGQMPGEAPGQPQN
ncbi:MAG: hypothetical protein Q4G30_08610 [Actinomycetaceae bacterium]|nr:hypothetical protein [Actinomycetaceae bacterium]